MLARRWSGSLVVLPVLLASASVLAQSGPAITLQSPASGALLRGSDPTALVQGWTPKASLPTARYSAAAVELNGKVYVIGGAPTFGTYCGLNEAYDELSGQWSTCTALSPARAGHGAAVLGGKIYVVGGRNPTVLSRVDQYDPATNAWQARTSLPKALMGVTVAVVGGKLYAIGGNQYPTAGPFSDVYSYDAVTNSWTSLASMPTARAFAYAAVVGTRIHVIGGQTEVGRNVYATANQAYEVSSNTWSSCAAAPFADANGGSASLGTRIYCLGGYVGPYRHSSYDAASDTWAQGGGLDRAIAFPTLTPVGGHLFQAGFYDPSNGGVSASSALYDPAQDEGPRTWRSVASLPVNRAGAVAATVRGRVYVVGGVDTAGASIITRVDELDPIMNQWSPKAPAPGFVSVNTGGVAALDNLLYAVATGPRLDAFDPAADRWTARRGPSDTTSDGGSLGAVGGRLYWLRSGASANVFLEYAPTTDQWRPRAGLGTPRSSVGLAESGGSLYAVGGRNASNTWVKVVERYDPDTDAWHAVADLPSSVSFKASVAGSANEVFALLANQQLVFLAPGATTWGQLMALPTAVTVNQPAFAACDGRLYACGGSAPTYATPSSEVAEFTAASRFVAVTGTVDPSTLVSLSCNGRVTTLVGDVLSVRVPALEGLNTLTVRAVDAAGTRSSLTSTFVLDGLGPILVLATPPYRSTTSERLCTFAGYATDEHGVAGVTVGGRPVSLTGAQFSSVTALQTGTHTIEVVAHDLAGNASSVPRTIWLTGDVGPGFEVQVTAPVSGSHALVGHAVQLQATCQYDYPPVTYSWSSTLDGTLGAGQTLVTTSLSAGTHVLTVHGVDAAGAEADGSSTLVVDDLPNLVVSAVIPNPATGLTNRTTVTLTAAIANLRAPTVTSAFDVDFLVDGASIGRQHADAGLGGGATTQVSTTWAATAGDHTVRAVADVANAVIEQCEYDNSRAQALPTVADEIPPEDPTNLRVECYDTHLVFRWNASPNTAHDLSGYKAYLGTAPAVSLGSTATFFDAMGLSAATAYPFKVAAADASGNESPGTSMTGITLLQNPTGLVVTPHSGYATLTWNLVQPSELVKQYRVYVSAVPYTSVQGLTPRFSLSGTTVNVAGLANETTYYFAVTSINLCDGERKQVTPLSAMPHRDHDGPVLSDFRFDAQPLVTGTSVARAGAFSVQAQDPAGVSRVEFSVDGAALGAASSTTGRYSVPWDPTPVADGAHTLTAVGYDSFSNATTATVAFVVTLAPPPAPTITYPSAALLTERKELQVSGAATTDVEVQLSVNGSPLSSATARVDSQSRFSIPLILSEGQNVITAAARNRAGAGPQSAAVSVTLDSSLPDRPTNFYAESKPAGLLRLSWSRPADPAIVGYRLYRSTSSFAGTTEAERVNAQPYTTGLQDDLPPQDGTWYYRAVSLDKLNRESQVSELAYARSDRLPPCADQIVWTAAGPHDPATGRVAPGRVDVLLRVSEPLPETPFLSLNPAGASPLSIPLSQGTTAVEYLGSLQIPPTAPSGQAWAVFSALDLVGNRGTAITSGATLLIDAKGPDVVRLLVAPGEPIKNDQATPVTLRVTIGLDDMQVTTAADLRFAVAGATPVSVAGLVRTTPATGEMDALTGQVVLPADAGFSAVENLVFTWHGLDDLGNASSQIRCQSSFQVYQGTLPPLAVPQGLTATSLPAGRVRLTWKAVPQAAGYRVYRKAASEPIFTELPDVDQLLELIETPPSEGVWTYAVASLRELDGERSPSASSAEVQVASDATPPGAPENLTLELVARGIQARWQVPPFTEAISYDLYRADGQQLLTVEGLTSLQAGLLLNCALDGEPSATDHCYAVVARDLAGNLSAPSNSAVLVVPVLPVRRLTVRHVDDALPTLSWSHEGTGISGFDLRVNGTKIGTAPFSGTSYVDAGYAQDERSYSVAAVSADGSQQSLARTLTLPLVTFQPEPGQKLRRNVMNRLRYQVQSRASTRFSNVKLTIVVEGLTCASEPFDLEPDATLTVPVVLPGYQSLPDFAPATATLELSPADGEQISLVRTTQLEVVNGLLVLTLETESFTRGATGRLRFNLENTGDEPVDLVLATKNGAAPSDALTVLLRDAQENVLSTTQLRQATGVGLLQLPDGRVATRVAPGAMFGSSTFTIPVATSCPDVVAVELVATPLCWRLGEPEAISLEGPRTSRQVSLIETPYDCAVTSVTPASSRGDVPVVIAGTSMDRASGAALPNLPVRIVVALAGFERTFQTYSGPEGTFSYAFQPLLGESGRYQVGATHPARTESPAQGFFTIQRLLVTPASFEVRTPTNYRAPLQVKVTAGREFSASNLRLTAVVPSGLHLDVGPPLLSLSAGQSALLTCAVWADASSPPTTSFDLEVRSDADAGTAWAAVRVFAQFSAAAPSLRVTPDHVETGVGLGDQVFESLVLENKGLATLRGLVLSVLDQSKTTSPTWVQLSTPVAPGDLAVGAKREVSLSFQPPVGFTEGQYTFYLRIRGQNQAPLDVPVFVAVTGSGQGAVLVHVSDIYTGTLDKDTHETVAGLAGATVKVQNELVASVQGTMATGHDGTASFTDLPVGRYRYRVSAPSHDDFNGSFWVKPGVTQTVEPFLRSQLITVEWSVAETTIRDTYSIALISTFQTDVPAAVVVAEPASVTLPPMRPGDVFNGSFQLTNHGLIRADDLALALPADDASFRYETLSPLPTSLDAKISISVPYRVICLAPTGPPLSGTGTGGGECRPIFKFLCTTYHFHCSNGDEYDQSVYHVTIVTEGDCGGSAAYSGTDVRTFADAVRIGLADGDPTGGTAPMPSGGGSAGGDGVTMRVAFDPNGLTAPGEGWFGTTEAVVAGRKCWPVQETTNEVFAVDPRGAAEELVKLGLHAVGCMVNGFTRDVYDDVTDLWIKVPGGTVTVRRRYYGQPVVSADGSGRTREYGWYFAPGPFTTIDVSQAHTSSFVTACGHSWRLDGRIVRQGAVYSSMSGDHWSHRASHINMVDSTTYQWTDKDGNWERYNERGVLLSWGSRFGVIGEVVLEAATGRALGVRDRNGRQVLWLDYASGRLTAARDYAGRRVDYQSVAGGVAGDRLLLTRVTAHPAAASEQVTTYEYQQTRVARSVDTGGRETRFSWDSSGNVNGVTDGGGHGHSFNYDHDATKNESYCRTISSIGRIEEEWFDARGNVMRQDVNGRTVRLVKRQGSEAPGSDAASLAELGYWYPGRIEETDEKGLVVVRERSYDGYPTKVTYPDGATVVLSYELGRYGQRVQQVYDVNGVRTRYFYDSDGNMIRRVDAVGTPAERGTSFTHDQSGLITSITAEADALTPAATSRFTYGPNGDLQTQTDPEGNVTEFLQYDVMGNLLEFKDPRGNRWQLEYDAVGRVLSTTDPLGRVTRREYDGANNLKALVDPLLKRYQFEYDDHDNQIRAIDPLGKSSFTGYDLNSLPAFTADRSNKCSYLSHDQEGRLRQVRDGADNVVQYEYDLTRTTKTSSFLPVRILYPTYSRELTYDVRQRLVRSTDVLSPNQSRSRSYGYDIAGNVVAETDEEGNVTRYERDERNRVVRVHDAQGGVTEQTYDDRSNVLSVKDATGNLTRFEYRLNGWLSKVIRPSGRETRYEYDPCGNRTAIIDALGQKAAMHYDAANRLDRTEYFTAADPQTPARVVQFGYDVRDLMTSWSDGAVSGVLTYDDLGRKMTETVNYGPFSLTNSYDYYDNGSRRSFTGPDGRTVTYARDANDRLSSLSIPDLGEVGYQQYRWNALTRLALPGGTAFEYGHDPLQRLTSSTSRDPAGNPLLTRAYGYTPSGDFATMVTERGAHQFQYDRHRLASATSPDLPAEAYTWDPLNNRQTSAQAPGPWTYSSDQELLTFPGGHCEYDAVGRTVRKVANGVEQVLRYDVTGRLEQLEDGTGFVMARYGYDPFGRRLWKQVAGTVTTYYAYGDEGLIGEYDESGNELCAYGYEPGSSWTTAPLWLRRNGSYYWYHTDHQGRPYKLTDTSGATVWEGLFDSFGTCTVLRAQIEQNLRLPGQYFDLESGLHYNWHRYYDPATGRYLQPDPLDEDVNPYAYAGGNPLSFVDPEGTCAARVLGDGYFIASAVTSLLSGGTVPAAALATYALYSAVSDLYDALTKQSSFAQDMGGLVQSLALGKMLGGAGKVWGWAKGKAGGLLSKAGAWTAGILGPGGQTRFRAWGGARGGGGRPGEVRLFRERHVAPDDYGLGGRRPPKGERHVFKNTDALRAHNNQVRRIASKYGMDPKTRRRFHDECSKQGRERGELLSPEEIDQVARDLLGLD